MSDYIKREDAIEAMENRFADIMRTHKRRVTTGEKTIASDMIETAKMVKSADVAPVRNGRWDCDMGGVWCSVCGEYSKGGEWEYCPYCGARMDGDSNE